MGNYQLYRTNVYLTGQMKYDLIINSIDDEDILLVDGFRITPISNNSLYRGISGDDILNCNNLWNIQQFYRGSTADFYDLYEPVFLKSENLLNRNNKLQTKDYNDEYEMGCRRTYKYKTGKEFNFFCPIWLEFVDKKIEFVVKLYADPKQTKLISSKTLTVDLVDDIKYDTHNKFNKYFKQYFEAIGLKNELKKPIDWVINIDKYGETIINGVNVKFGAANEYNVGKLPYELTSMERPLIDQDDIIISRLKNNQLITKQLLNFNLCFDLKDIISDNIIHIGLKSADYWFIDVDVLVDGELLETRDLFSNYEFIHRPQYSPIYVCDHDIDSDSDSLYEDPALRQYNISIKETDLYKHNILSYLRDYKAVDYINKNKITQSIIHWCYSGIDGLLYEHYLGNSGYLRSLSDANDITWLSGSNPMGVPELTMTEYDERCNQYWCSSILLKRQYLKTKECLKEFFRKPYLYKYMFSKFSNNCYVKNVNYNSSLCDNNTNLYVTIILDDANIIDISTILGRIDYTKTVDVDSIFISDIDAAEPEREYTTYKKKIFKYVEVIDKSSASKDYYIMIFINPHDIQYVLPLNNFIKSLENYSSYYIDILMENNKHFSNTYSGDDTKTIRVCDVLIDILKHYNFNKLNTTSIPVSIYPYKCPGPTVDTDEVKYNKNKKSLLIKRYVGKITPYFISKDDINKNYLYRKKYSDEVDEKYHIYNNHGFKPNYPSVNYYNLVKNYQCYNPSDMQDFDHSSLFEYNSFHYNKIQNLKSEIYDRVSVPYDVSIHDYIEGYIKNYYNDRGIYMGQILNLYEYECDFIKKDDNNNKVYNIKIKLK